MLTNIENIYGSSFGDTLSGYDIRNIIGGEGGDDLIDGNGGDDALAGEAGDDIVNGDDGNDRLVGGAGADILHGDAGNDSMDGGTENDQIFGDDGNDSMTGGAGADSLDGGEGNDILEGGAGADTLTGGNGIDTVSYASAGAGVVVVLGGVSTGGDAAGDTMSGIEQVLGSSFADTITGDADANTMWGLGGDDILIGGFGADILKGGAGNDSFTYVAIGDSTVAAAGRDTVADFTTGDKIDLAAIDADGNAENGDTAFTFDTGAFTGARADPGPGLRRRPLRRLSRDHRQQRRGCDHRRLFRPRPDRGGFRAVKAPGGPALPPPQPGEGGIPPPRRFVRVIIGRLSGNLISGSRRFLAFFAGPLELSRTAKDFAQSLAGPDPNGRKRRAFT